HNQERSWHHSQDAHPVSRIICHRDISAKHKAQTFWRGHAVENWDIEFRSRAKFPSPAPSDIRLISCDVRFRPKADIAVIKPLALRVRSNPSVGIIVKRTK